VNSSTESLIDRVPSVGWRIREPGSRFVPRICSINFSISAGLVFGISSPLPILDPSPSHSRGADYFGQPLPQIAIDWEDSSAVYAFSQLRRLTEGTQIAKDIEGGMVLMY
jgi:hypothetical protein